MPWFRRRSGPKWPRHASVAFINVCARYRPGLPLVVKDLTFDVKAGQKVGVVGQYSDVSCHNGLPCMQGDHKTQY